jgi:enoyl-CoA hydratase
MNASDAILAGFADHFVPEADWPVLTETLIETGDCTAVNALARDPEDGPLMGLRETVDAHFGKASLEEIVAGRCPTTGGGRPPMKSIRAASPLSAALHIGTGAAGAGIGRH